MHTVGFSDVLVAVFRTSWTLIVARGFLYWIVKSPESNYIYKHSSEWVLFFLWVLYVCVSPFPSVRPSTHPSIHPPVSLSVHVISIGQKRASDSLWLELETVVSCHVGAENRTWVLCESRVPSTLCSCPCGRFKAFQYIWGQDAIPLNLRSSLLRLHVFVLRQSCT